MGLAIGVDIGGTKISAGLVDDKGKILARRRMKTPVREAEQVETAVCQLVTALQGERSVEAVGIGVAGFVDDKRSRVVFGPNLGWTDEPLRAAIESEVALPVIIENDANAAAWGEFRYGAGKRQEYMAMITVGTGIGGGFVLGGRLFRGRYGMAGEFGHLVVKMGGRQCGCGKKGCWEQYASGNALVREARKLAADRRPEAETLLGLGDGTPEGVTGQHVTQAARAGDPVAQAALDSLADWLAVGMADVVTLVDPACFVIGGGVSEAGDLFLPRTIQALTSAVSGHEHRVLPTVVRARLGNDAGVIGAADLARHP